MSDPIEFLKILRALPPYAANKLFREKLAHQRRAALLVQAVRDVNQIISEKSFRERQAQGEVETRPGEHHRRVPG